MAISKDLIKQNKGKLLVEKKRLLSMLSHISKKDEQSESFRVEYPEFGSKEDENASEVTAYETNLAEEYDLESKLRKVEAALKRIEAGMYGICFVGGEEISIKRLVAVPEAVNCVEHETA